MTPIILVGAFAIAATAYAISSSSSADRADCPGKIVCPVTGEFVCKDRCPVDSEKNQEQPVLLSCCQSSN